MTDLALRPAAALLFASLALAVTACSPRDSGEHVQTDSPELPEEQRLTLEAIFTDGEYDAKSPGRIRWLADGSGYTMVEDVEGYDDDNPDLDEDGEELPAPKEIVFYDPATDERRVLVSAAALTPEGEDRPLAIDGYSCRRTSQSS